MQDADAILADCADLMAHHGLNAATARAAVDGMLDEQPLPLAGKAAPSRVTVSD
jgi:heterodisulfide reductase subunit D